MSYCSNCGAEVEGRFCAKCGTPVDSTSPASSAQDYPSPQDVPGLSNNVAGALCYSLGIFTGVIFLLLAPYSQSRFVRFHAFQAIFYHLALIVMVIGFAIIQAVMMFALPRSLVFVLGLSPILIWLGGLILWILLMVKAYKNERFKLPIIGNLAEKQA